MREAASIVDSGLKKSVWDRHGACYAINRACRKLYKVPNLDFQQIGKKLGKKEASEIRSTMMKIQGYFASMFEDSDGRHHKMWWFGSDTSVADHNSIDAYQKRMFGSEAQKHRIFALLMTAAVCESIGE